MITLRQFNEDNYIEFAGAEEFEGMVPLIGDLCVDGQDAHVVVDLHSVQVIWLHHEFAEPTTMAFHGTYWMNKLIAEGLRTFMDTTSLINLGFTKIGG